MLPVLSYLSDEPLLGYVTLVVAMFGGLAGLIGLIVAATQFNANNKLREQIEALSHRLHQLEHPPKSINPPEAAQPSTAAQAQPAPASKRETLTRLIAPEVIEEPEPTPAPSIEPMNPAPTQPVSPVKPEQPEPAPASPPAPVPPPRTPDAAPASPGFALEKFLGTKMLVWLGGVALAIACAFLMHHSFKHNWTTPWIRVVGGTVFGLALPGVAEWLRARARVVAQALCGAGIACLYAVIFAASNLYQFIGSPTDFLFSVAVTAAAVALSLRHGVFTAALGLAGGFIMPILLRTGEPVGASFFAYLLLLQGGLIAVARRRQWIGLTIATLLAMSMWGILSVFELFPITDRVWPELMLLSMAGSFALGAVPSGDKPSAHRATHAVVSGFASCIALVLLMMHAGVGEFEPRGLGMVGLMAAGCVVLARVDKRYLPLPWVALAGAAIMLLSYGGWAAGMSDSERQAIAWLERFSFTAGGYWAVLGLGAFACLWRSRQPGYWAALSGAAGLLLLLVYIPFAWTLHPQLGQWWWLTLGAALVYAAMMAACYVASRLAGTPPDRSRPVTVLMDVVNVLAVCTIGLAWYDDAPWMRLGWAGWVLVCVWLMQLLELPRMREAVGVCAGLVGCCAVFPGPFFEMSQTPVANELLLGYGGPAVLLGVSAWRAMANKQVVLSQVLQGLTLWLAFAGVTVITRHAFAGNDWLAELSLRESATLGNAWIILGLVSLLLGSMWRQDTLGIGGNVMAVSGTCLAILLNGTALNPLLHDESVGHMIVLNWLLYLYLLPAGLALAWAFLLRRSGQAQLTGLRVFAGVACLLLVFAWVSLAVRQGFAGEVLDVDLIKVTRAEWYTYSMAWVGLGLILLLIGTLTRSAAARWGSLVVMMLAVVKVFIFDAANLRDLYRVLSFFGLGVSLIGLGYVYQRFVFRRPKQAKETGAEPESRPQD